MNFEGYEIKSLAEIDAIRGLVEQILTPLNKKVPAVVNYDNFAIAPDLLDAYMDVVHDLTERFYSRVTRYTTSTFMRSYMGGALRRHDTEPELYASEEEALLRLGDK